MAAGANSEPFVFGYNFLLYPEILQSIVFCEGDQLGPGAEIWLHGGVAFTALTALFWTNSYNFLAICRNQGHLHHESLRSWYGEEKKFGGAQLHNTFIIHLDKQIYSRMVSLGAEIDNKPPSVTRPNATRMKIMYCLTENRFLS
jgi:hypothetical protein